MGVHTSLYTWCPRITERHSYIDVPKDSDVIFSPLELEKSHVSYDKIKFSAPPINIALWYYLEAFVLNFKLKNNSTAAKVFEEI